MGNIVFYVLSALLVTAPFVFSPVSSELFEFPKLLVIYFAAAFLFPLVAYKTMRLFTRARTAGKETRFESYQNPFVRHRWIFLAILLFSASQVLSALFSIDRHVSIFGYYSRFNGGLLSLFSYLILFLSALLYLKRKDLDRLLAVSLTTAFIIGLWGLPSHFGSDLICLAVLGKFDTSCWTADFIPEERMFATLGQPNWFAAYLVVHIFIVLYFLSKRYLSPNKNHGRFLSYILMALFVFFSIELVWTKSSSGILAYIVLVPAYLIGFVLLFKTPRKRTLAAILAAIAILSLVLGGYFLRPHIGKLFSAGESSATPSGRIRLIVWEGAWNLGLRYPVFGTGVETFAYSYYFTRPAAHNLTSEWNFVYNKAHNEPLNYLATTGFLGMGSYILMYLAFLIPAAYWLLAGKRSVFALFYLAVMLTLFVSNFFGFATTVTSVYFFILPGMYLVSRREPELEEEVVLPTLSLKNVIGYSLYTLFILVYLMNYYSADYYYARSRDYRRLEDVTSAYQELAKAIALRREPTYLNDQAFVSAHLSAAYRLRGAEQEAVELAGQAVSLNSETLSGSPKNINYLKTKAKIGYLFSLSQREDKEVSTRHYREALAALEEAARLAPTDPGIPYTQATLMAETEPEKAAVLLRKTLSLKPDHTEARALLQTFEPLP